MEDNETVGYIESSNGAELKTRFSTEAEVWRHALVGIASSNSLYPCSEENLLSSVGTITSIDRSTTGRRRREWNRTEMINHAQADG